MIATGNHIGLECAARSTTLDRYFQVEGLFAGLCAGISANWIYNLITMLL